MGLFGGPAAGNFGGPLTAGGMGSDLVSTPGGGGYVDSGGSDQGGASDAAMGGASSGASAMADAGSGAFVDSGSFDSAKGNIFPGAALRDYSSKIVYHPTYFRFAKGGAIGQMGEAGPEAVMPLTRGQDGKLGVAGGGSRGHTIVMNVQTPDANSFRNSSSQLQAPRWAR